MVASGRALALVGLIVLAGCTSADEAAAPAPTAIRAAEPTATTAPESTVTVAPAPTSTTAPAPTAITAAEPTPDVVPEPGRPSASTGADGGGAWIGRGAMSETEIELFWAGPDDVTSYTIRRVRRVEVPDPDLLAPTDGELVYLGLETGLVDDTLEPGEQYWYVLVAQLADGSVQQRWAIADAVTDDEPPAQVTGLVATRVADTIELTWDQSSDNYRFERYAIRRSVDGSDSIYYGTGFTIDQTMFIDDQLPSTGTITYQLIAVDFHDNLADPTRVTVRVG